MPFGGGARDEDEAPVIHQTPHQLEARADEIHHAGAGKELVGGGIAVTEAPARAGPIKEHSALGVGHDAAPRHVGELVAEPPLVDTAAALAILEEVESLLDGILARTGPHVAAKDPVDPGSVIAAVADKA